MFLIRLPGPSAGIATIGINNLMSAPSMGSKAGMDVDGNGERRKMRSTDVVAQIRTRRTGQITLEASVDL